MINRYFVSSFIIHHLETPRILYSDFPQTAVGVAYFEDAGIISLVILNMKSFYWQLSSLRKLRLTDHVTVWWVEGLFYQGEVLFPNPSLDLEQMSINPGLILKQEVNIHFNDK